MVFLEAACLATCLLLGFRAWEGVQDSMEEASPGSTPALDSSLCLPSALELPSQAPVLLGIYLVTTGGWSSSSHGNGAAHATPLPLLPLCVAQMSQSYSMFVTPTSRAEAAAWEVGQLRIGLPLGDLPGRQVTGVSLSNASRMW